MRMDDIERRVKERENTIKQLETSIQFTQEEVVEKKFKELTDDVENCSTKFQKK